jgi:uncharacterized membrane protein YhiD involved in acid resistance
MGESSGAGTAYFSSSQFLAGFVTRVTWWVTSGAGTDYSSSPQFLAGFVTRVTWWVTLVEQELLTLPHLSF